MNYMSIYTLCSRKLCTIHTRKASHHSKETLHGYVELYTNKKSEFCNQEINMLLLCMKPLASISLKSCCQMQDHSLSTNRTFSCTVTMELMSLDDMCVTWGNKFQGVFWTDFYPCASELIPLNVPQPHMVAGYQ
jgi:hypothetical protein